MAALSALLKTWVILQTLCLALAQVVSGWGKLSATLLMALPLYFWGLVRIRAPGKGQKPLEGMFGVVCCLVAG